MRPLDDLVRRLRNAAPQGSFGRAVAALAGGIATGQAIAVLVSPILTRLYTPDDFGVLAVYAAVLGVITIVAGLRYEAAIPLPRSNVTAVRVLRLAQFCVLGSAIVSIGLISGFGESLAEAMHAPAVADLLWLLPVSVTLAGFYQAYSYWAVRKDQFAQIAKTKVQQGLTMAAAQVVLGALQVGAVGLVVGHVLAQSSGLLRLVGVFRRTRPARRQHTVSSYSGVASRYRRFPMFTTWGGLLSVAGSQLPPLALAALFSPAAAGMYMIAQRVGSQPLSLVGTAIGQVFFGKASIARRDGSMSALTLNTFRTLVGIGALPIVLIAIASPAIFAVVFGSAWVESGHYLRWLAPWLLVQFVVSPISGLALVFERQSIDMALQGTLLGVRLTAFLIGWRADSVQVSLILFGLGSAIVLGTYGMWVLTVAGVQRQTIGRTVLLELGIVGVVLLAVTGAHRLIGSLLGKDEVALIAAVIGIGVPATVWRLRRLALSGLRSVDEFPQVVTGQGVDR